MSGRVLVASSNLGKLREYRELAQDSGIPLDLIPHFEEITEFEETAPTFAENGAGKAIYYSRYASEMVVADDSGLVVPALGGAPGVYSARYAGPHATAAERVAKLLGEMAGKEGEERRARFVCVAAVARAGRVLAVVSDFVEGVLTKEAQGNAGFGYDPIFMVPELGHTFGESSAEEKNNYSHRGRAFRKMLGFLRESQL